MADEERLRLQALELTKAIAGAARGMWPLCLGCNKRVNVLDDDGTWKDVGIGDYAHNGCGPEMLRGATRSKRDWDHEHKRRWRRWLTGSR